MHINPKFSFPLKLGAWIPPFMPGYSCCQCVCSPFTLYYLHSLPRTLYLFIPLIYRAVSDENQTPFGSSGMVSGCAFVDKQMKYNALSDALSVPACHHHTPMAPPSAQTLPGAQPWRAAVLGRNFGVLAVPGGFGMAKTPRSLHASPKPCPGGRLLISASENATCW